ncbi:MAG TPA: HD domain-containing phosphohydrolase [Terriglobales bacterium]|nr:HD domain-containing phosphohydrolase [Terriglobales bacterium]
MDEKILFVDDEVAALEGYKRLFRTEFKIDTANSGKSALSAISQQGPYAVVVSDMKMPEMDGIQLLSKVKTISPETIRIMLTGQAGLEAAIEAVNEGNIFRFLTKPSNKETLGKTLTAALVQYRLVIAEKELLEKTLRASIHVLTEVLSLVNPAAFSRATRLRRYMSHVVKVLGLGNPWRFEVAAMMSQLGCVVLDAETINAVFAGQELPPEEQARYDAHPLIARDLLVNIPRMEPIAWMIAHQNQPAPVEGDVSDREMADMRLGAELLRATLAFDDLLRKGISRTEAGTRLARQRRDLDSRIFYALVELDPERDDAEVRTCTVEQLAAGMILDEDVYAKDGSLIVARGQEVTVPLTLKLKTFHDKDAIKTTIRVTISKSSQTPDPLVAGAKARAQTSTV